MVPLSVNPAQLINVLTVPKVLSVDEITFLQSSISAKSALTKIHLEPIFSISSFTFNP